MKAAEKGFLLLTSQLGDPQSKPLTVAQFRRLTAFARNMEKPTESRELTCEDLMQLGYDRQWADHILRLLNREEQLEYYVNQAARNGCYPITRIGADYPENLRNRLGNDAPGSLWARGDRNLLNQPAIALVGSRDLSEENRKFAEEAGRQAALQGYVLVSGNARGADKTAQDSCLEAGGQVISIVADSLKKCKDRSDMLYLSEDGFDCGFSTLRALSRNRLIHAMGLLTLVAQCSYCKGGTWTGTTQNLQHDWSPVFCFQDGSDGVRELTQCGANAVDIGELADFKTLQKQNISFFD